MTRSEAKKLWNKLYEDGFTSKDIEVFLIDKIFDSIEDSDSKIIKVITGKPYNGGILGIMATKFPLEQHQNYSVIIKTESNEKPSAF